MKSLDTKKNKKESDHLEDDFKGYTMEELRYQRALLALKKEYVKEKALHSTMEIKEQIPILNGNSPAFSLKSHGLAGKILRGLDFADYIVLGMQGIKIGKKIGSFFKKK